MSYIDYKNKREEKSIRKELFDIYTRLGDITYAIDEILTKYEETGNFDSEWLENILEELQNQRNKLYSVALQVEE